MLSRELCCCIVKHILGLVENATENQGGFVSVQLQRYRIVLRQDAPTQRTTSSTTQPCFTSATKTQNVASSASVLRLLAVSLVRLVTFFFLYDNLFPK